ncbi:ran-binding protein 3 [Trichechus manatus latirostris]|uniref:Ran-binding protein 3 n=1 Tax=Trichechus manatus latirostris TaxID=127582 RepID=A0A2Y9RBE3_TRIMA|nr:ran-binding protein 3 [Trichechus manatus latirostris]
MADLANEEKPAIAPPVFVFQKDKGHKSSAEQKDLSDSGEEPRGEAEAPHHGMGHPESAGEHALEPPAPASAPASAPPRPAPEAQLLPFPRELAGRSAGGSSPEGGEDSDREDGNYCPPVKRERTSSLTQFPPSQSVSKNNVFMPSTFCESSAGNSDSEPGEPPSQPVIGSIGRDERQASCKIGSSPGMHTACPFSVCVCLKQEKEPQKNESSSTSEEENCERKEQAAQQAFVFGQNLRDRVKLINENTDVADVENAGHPSSETPTATNYFLQYISSSLENSTNSADSSSNKFVFGQNMSARVLSPPKLNEVSSDANRENTAAESRSESSSQEATPEKESLAESAAAYTKATARKCLLEKVEVITGEEAESNVLQIQCKLFVFDKASQSWVERGRGLLRLNDMASADDGTLQSRLVMRTQGSLRLILNTKLWAQMQIDKASEKSVRVTATDTEDQGVKVFLISASSKDTGQLYAALHHRILALRSRVEQEQEARVPAPEPGVAPSNEEDDSDDDVLAPSGATGGGAGDEGDGPTAGST